MKKWIQLLAVLSFCTACNRGAPHTAQPTAIENETPAEELIIGGHTVTKKNEIANTTVSLLDTRRGSLCTASILSEEVAITAAHCVTGDATDMQISFGPRSTGHEVRPVIETATSSVWSQRQHEEFNNGDIALVHFSGGLPKGATAVSLMKASHRLANGEIVTLAGFGLANATGTGAGVLRAVDVKIANANYSQSEVSLDQTNRKGACHGDSGGPAFIQDNQGGLQMWGITSRGINDPGDRCAGFTVYTRVQPYVRWINSVVRGWRK